MYTLKQSNTLLQSNKFSLSLFRSTSQSNASNFYFFFFKISLSLSPCFVWRFTFSLQVYRDTYIQSVSVGGVGFAHGFTLRSSTAFHGSTSTTTPPTHIVFFSLLGFFLLSHHSPMSRKEKSFSFLWEKAMHTFVAEQLRRRRVLLRKPSNSSRLSAEATELGYWPWFL